MVWRAQRVRIWSNTRPPAFLTIVASTCSQLYGLTAIDYAHDLLRFGSIPKIVYGLRRGSEQDTKMEALDMFVVP
jgi:hypothetical protein